MAIQKAVSKKKVERKEDAMRESQLFWERVKEKG